jgi:hypothetical protein
MNASTVWKYSQAPTHVARAATGIDFAYRQVGNRGPRTPAYGRDHPNR